MELVNIKSIWPNEYTKCCLCRKYLSVFPILSKSDREFVCGRCKINGNEKLERQILYEFLAEKLQFPCSFDQYGCTELLTHTCVLEHENDCEFKTINCPLFYNICETVCMWNGSSSQVVRHIKDEHSDLFTKTKIINFTSIKSPTVYFVDADEGQVAAVILKYVNEMKRSCLVVLIGSEELAKCYRFQLTFDTEKEENNAIVLRRNYLQSSENISEIIADVDYVMDIDFSFLKTVLQKNSSIIGNISVQKKKKKDIVLSPPVTEDTLENTPFNKELLETLECPICNEYMAPPIYICQTGHSFCNNCREQINNCPSCRLPLGNARNYTLENLTAVVKYPCRNRESNCTYSATADLIKIHEKTCGKCCPFDCVWKGKSIIEHLHTFHSQRIILENEFYLHDLNSDRKSFMILIKGKNIFKIGIKTQCKMGPLDYFVSYHGDCKAIWKYQLHLQQCATADEGLTLTGICLKNNGADLFDTSETIPIELIRRYIFEHHYIYFKVNLACK